MLGNPINRFGCRDRLPFWLLTALFLVMWLAGGASRADTAGQAITRFFASVFLVIFALFAPRLDWRGVKPILFFLAATVGIVALQMVPLPPGLWIGLPGHELLARAAEVTGQLQPWRPVSISPSATANALGSLLIPITVLVLAANLRDPQHWQMAGLVLALVFGGCVLALLQVSGAQFHNPLMNQVAGSISGNFANRNHFALFVALGCLLAPTWGFRGEGAHRWKGIATLSLVPFFLLILLATGSRAGLGLGAIALVLAFAIERRTLISLLRSRRRGLVLILLAFSLLAVAAAITASVMSGRAIAVDRALRLNATDDLRSQAAPYVIKAASQYFPFGSGFGTFDPAYRIVEPNALLRLTYFNHAHNDWLEIVLNGGIAGVVLLVAFLAWYASASFRAWRGLGEATNLARLGAAGLFLIMTASLVDYPARTPLIMGFAAMAAIWLQRAFKPVPKQPLRPA